ncbi:MAG: hypothetical protein GY786_12800, partial [Proteobacteria bacterium]|nr:hypothetical protein [Pseudomonadota bacterium]
MITDEGKRLVDEEEYTFNTLPPVHIITCYHLAEQLRDAINERIEENEAYFSKLAQEDENLDSLSDKQKFLHSNTRANNELNYTFQGVKKQMDQIFWAHGDFFDLATFAGNAMTLIAQGKAYLATNANTGIAKSTEQLTLFLHSAPVNFGYASWYFQIFAEICLFLSVFFGRFMFLFRTW